MRFRENRAEQKQRFSIKKYSFGAASVLIGATFLVASGGLVQAQEEVAPVVNSAQETQLESENLNSSTAEDTTEEAIEVASEAQVQQESVSSSQTTSESQVVEEQASTTESSSEKSEAESPAQSETASSNNLASQPVANAVVRRSVATTQAQVASQETVTVTEQANGFQLQYNGKIASNEAIKFAVWTERNGQNDLVWYDASATGAAFVDFSKHREYGKYNIHTYSSQSGRMIGRDAKVYDLKTPSISAVIKHTGVNSYQVTLSNVPDSITNVSLPTWSDKNGQDDIKWVTASKTANRTYTANIKTPEVGHYSIHVYGQSRVTGGTIGLLATSGLDNTGKAPSQESTSTSQTDSKPSQPSQNQVSPKVTTTLSANGLALSLTQGVSGDLSKVRFAVWSEKNGQDDLKWYDADAKGNALAPYQNHKDFGSYNVHTYLSTDKGMVGLNATKVDIPAPAVKTEIKKLSDKSYQVLVTQVPDYISSITVPVWSDQNGQDDIKWVSATKTANGSYQATVNLSDHQFNQGHYSVHIYGNSKIGGDKFIGLATTSGFTVEATQVADQQPTITVTNHDEKNGTLQVQVNQGSKAIKKVRVAAWSQANQANLHWYEVTPNNGKAVVTVDERQHKFIKGNYTVHAYVDFSDGTSTAKDLGQYSLQAEKKGAASKGNYDVFNHIVYLDAGHGGYDPGASYFGRSEKNLTLTIQNLVKQKLESAGYTVVTSRDNDTFVDLLDRSKKVNASDSDIFVSIHFNAAGSSSASGIETYYYEYGAGYPSRINATYHNNSSRLSLSNQLANSLQSNIVASTSGKNNGVKRNTFAVLRETTAPAVLLELGYISNPNESQLIATSAYQEKLANGIVKGILDYYKKQGAALSSSSSNTGTSKPSTDVKEPVKLAGKVEVTAVDDVRGTISVKVTGVSSPTGVKDVLLPIWSEENGQDDIKWYIAAKQSDGSYTLTVKASDHNYSNGQYNIHLYYRDNSGKLQGVSGTSATLKLEAQTEKTYTVDGKSFKILGAYSPNNATLQSIANAIKTLENQGYSAGFKMMDVDSRYGIEYNGSSKFYSASAIKGPFVGSLAIKNESAINRSKATIKDMLRTSNNEEYSSLVNTYGLSSLKAMARDAGVDDSIFKGGYTNISANDMFALWNQMYQYFNGSQQGQEVGSWYQNPNLSAIKSTLGGSYKTQSKAGWIAYPGYHSASDAGIVYTPQGNYVLAIMSNADGKLNLLNGLVASLNNLHTESKGGTVTSQTQAPSIPQSGTYTFTKSADVKNEPKASSETLATYNAGDQVNYDSVVQAEGSTWLSYISYSGVRRYVNVG